VKGTRPPVAAAAAVGRAGAAGWAGAGASGSFGGGGAGKEGAGIGADCICPIRHCRRTHSRCCRISMPCDKDEKEEEGEATEE
jgi:hypothetical protein